MGQWLTNCAKDEVNRILADATTPLYVAEPHATEFYTAESLAKQGLVGIYAYDSTDVPESE